MKSDNPPKFSSTFKSDGVFYFVGEDETSRAWLEESLPQLDKVKDKSFRFLTEAEARGLTEVTSNFTIAMANVKQADFLRLLERLNGGLSTRSWVRVYWRLSNALVRASWRVNGQTIDYLKAHQWSLSLGLQRAKFYLVRSASDQTQ